MGSLKSLLAKPFAKIIYNRIQKWANNPVEIQNKVFQDLISKASGTQFGRDHDFISINSYEDFIKRIIIKATQTLWYVFFWKPALIQKGIKNCGISQYKNCKLPFFVWKFIF